MPESNIFEKFGELRKVYPEDIKRIEEDEKRVKELLLMREYSEQEATKELLRLCRLDVVMAKKRLATDRALEQDARRDLWLIIDSRMWFIHMVSKDFNSELAQIEADLDKELQP